MKTYNIKWEISLEASNSSEAAKKALQVLLRLNDPENIATVFEVDEKTIDLFQYKNKLISKMKIKNQNHTHVTKQFSQGRKH